MVLREELIKHEKAIEAQDEKCMKQYLWPDLDLIYLKYVDENTKEETIFKTKENCAAGNCFFETIADSNLLRLEDIRAYQIDERKPKSKKWKGPSNIGHKHGEPIPLYAWLRKDFHEELNRKYNKKEENLQCYHALNKLCTMNDWSEGMIVDPEECEVRIHGRIKYWKNSCRFIEDIGIHLFAYLYDIKICMYSHSGLIIDTEATQKMSDPIIEQKSPGYYENKTVHIFFHTWGLVLDRDTETNVKPEHYIALIPVSAESLIEGKHTITLGWKYDRANIPELGTLTRFVFDSLKRNEHPNYSLIKGAEISGGPLVSNRCLVS